MKDGLERELRQIVEELKRLSLEQDRRFSQIDKSLEELNRLTRRLSSHDGDDNPVSSVPAPLKPVPSRDSGAVALPEPEENTFSDPPPTSLVPKPLTDEDIPF